MSDEEPKVPEELFKDVKFYVVGDIDQKVRLWTLALLARWLACYLASAIQSK